MKANINWAYRTPYVLYSYRLNWPTDYESLLYDPNVGELQRLKVWLSTPAVRLYALQVSRFRDQPDGLRTYLFKIHNIPQISGQDRAKRREGVSSLFKPNVRALKVSRSLPTWTIVLFCGVRVSTRQLLELQRTSRKLCSKTKVG